MSLIPIDNLDDARLDLYCRLTDHELRNKLDPARAVVMVESEIAIRAALDRGLEPLSFLINERKAKTMADVLEKLNDTVDVYLCPQELSEKITGYKVTRGVLAAMKRPLEPTLKELLATSQRLAVLEGLVDTTNVGAIFRSAAALGLDGVIISPDCCDPLARRAVRVSMGNVFALPWVRARAPWPEDCYEALRAAGFCVAALSPSRDALSLDEAALCSRSKVALVLGTEGEGLSNAAMSQADLRVSIPMASGVDSLNVGAAAAIAFWELGATRLRSV